MVVTCVPFGQHYVSRKPHTRRTKLTYTIAEYYIEVTTHYYSQQPVCKIKIKLKNVQSSKNVYRPTQYE